MTRQQTVVLVDLGYYYEKLLLAAKVECTGVHVLYHGVDNFEPHLLFINHYTEIRSQNTSIITTVFAVYSLINSGHD